MIKAALLTNSEAWQNLLIQMGICYEIISDSGYMEIPRDCTLFIINSSLSVSARQFIEKLDLTKISIITTPEASKTSEKDDMKTECEYNNEKYYFDRPLIFYHKSDRIIKNSTFLPFSLDEAFEWTGSKRKQFYAKTKELPTENVCKTNLQDVFRYVWNLIVDVITEKKGDMDIYSILPENKPLLIFRIDTDFGLENDINDLYNICREKNIAASWFVDTFSEKMIDAYTGFEDQEIALHCDRHYVYKKMEQNERNIVRANQNLLNSGCAPRGFAAPFGDWNPGLETVLFNHDYLYSSEFSFAYNCLPIIRWHDESRMLQIPVHPINPSRLRRSHFTDVEMVDYYIDWIEQCRQRRIPAIIYQHPNKRLNAVIAKVFDYVNKAEFNNLTFENYAIWWLKRADILCQRNTDELMLKTSLKKDIIDYPEDYDRIYNKSWRYLQHELEAAKSRAHFKKSGYPQHLI